MGAMNRTLWITLVGLGAIAALGCQPPSDTPEAASLSSDAGTSSATGPQPALSALLAQGVAYTEINRWQEAREVFERAAAIDAGEPAPVFNLAVVDFRDGAPQAARQRLEQLPAQDLPPALSARLSYLRGRLAYEDGRLDDEKAAYEEAMRLAPEEAVYPYALAELYKRLPDVSAAERGALLERAYELWPDNARLGSDYAYWALGQPSEETRRRGLEVLERLVSVSPKEKILSYMNSGREEFKLPEYAQKIPPSFRATFNLLLGTKAFQSAASALESQLQALPIVEVIGEPEAAAGAPPEIELIPASFAGLGMATGEQLLEVVALSDASDEPEPLLAALSDQALYLRRAGNWSRLVDLGSEPRQLLSGELTDDGVMELIVLSRTGVSVWQRDGASWRGSENNGVTDPAQAGSTRIDGFESALLIDFEHDGDLDLLALDRSGRLFLFTHRGAAGWGSPVAAPLAVEQPIRSLAATDLDRDHDQDLVLGGERDLLVLRNWRQGDFSVHERHPMAEPALQILALEHGEADGLSDLITLTATGLSLWRSDREAHLSLDAEASADLSRRVERLAPHRAALGDLDLDGDLDLLVAGDTAVMALANTGAGFVSLAVADAGTSGGGFDGVLPFDLDGDRDADLLAWGRDHLQAFTNRGAESQHWLDLRLRAPTGKVPLDARGVKLQVVTGERSLWFEPEQPNLIVGLGTGAPALVKATWPNGISEYLFDPEPNSAQTLTLSMRVEGSCPFVYAESDQGMRFITDILGLSPLGMLLAKGEYVRPDPEEYLRLPDWVEERDGRVELRITEELREVTYLDQVELVVVDAPREVAIYNGERWLRQGVEGLALRLMTPLEAPVSVLSHSGAEVVDVVRQQDDVYLTNHTGDQRYQGAVAPHRLTVELPPGVAAAPNPALILVGWLHWGNTSTHLARSQDPNGAPIFPYLEVPDGRGGWRRTGVEVGLPAGKTKEIVVDLSGAIDPADPRLRLTTDFEVYWDRIAVAELRDPAATPHAVHRLSPSTAELRFGGFSRWYRPAANGPYLFDYDHRRSYPWRLDPEGREITLAWQEHEGFYTEYGPVDELLGQIDDRFVVFGSGEEIALSFSTSALPPLERGWQRRYFLHSEGWEKDGDPNVACSQTVEPLPHRGMSEDPCAGLEAGRAGALADDRRRRWVSRDRLLRRIEALVAADQATAAQADPRPVMTGSR